MMMPKIPFPITPDSCKIDSTAIIYPNVQLGENVTIRAYAVVGSPAESNGHWEGPGTGVIIGDDVIISEFVTIHSGTVRPTKVGAGVKLLRGSHVGHDVEIGDCATISCNVMLGGHSEVGEGANLGLGAILHQFSKVGAYAMVGMGSVVPKKKRLVPGKIYAGNPVKFLRENNVGLERQGVTRETLQAKIVEYFHATQDWKE